MLLQVRAMFDERRGRGAGIDKSYLLAPITVETNKTTTISNKRQVIAPAKATREQKMSNYSKVIVPPLQNRTTNNHDINGNNHYKNAINEPPTTTIDRSFRPVDTPVVNFKPRGIAATKTVNAPSNNNASTMKRPTPVVSSTSPPPPQPLKNVTNQKVRRGIFAPLAKLNQLIFKSQFTSVLPYFNNKKLSIRSSKASQTH